MICPKCGYKYPAVIVYGYCVDENENEYPFDARVFETGGSLPAWGIDGEFNGYFYVKEKWPTRFCYECRHRFYYVEENEAMGLEYEEAINIANQEAHQQIQWESIEKMQDMYPYIEWGWMGFVMVGFDRALLDDEELEIAE
jgi:hypothetical protein